MEQDMADNDLQEVSKEKLEKLANQCLTLRELYRKRLAEGHEYQCACKAANSIIGKPHGQPG